MKAQRLTHMALASLATFLVVFLGASNTGVAQQGPAAKGGSLTRTRIDDAGPSKSRKVTEAKADDPEQYRREVKSLNLDFSFLAGEYKNAQRKAPSLRFDDAVMAALAAASQKPQAAEETTHALLVKMAKKKTLTEALQDVLNLSEARARSVAGEAAARLSQVREQLEEPRNQ
jgi:hypothetical protein